ncbi:MAG TPA: carboxypeptidase regulatory-like domain-containing protein, partial [Acidobacteriaceae bacterium]|nr:carboxypeptidase regulatory-like domain-containing protein [Acidobacteriaceae bacterium]
MVTLKKILLAASLSSFFLFSLPLQAQMGRVTGLISGTVTDSSGAPIPNAVIAITGTDGLVRRIYSNSAGSFTLLNLPTETYHIEATATGFAPYTQQGIVVAVGREVQLSILMLPAGAKTIVTVSAQSNTLDTTQTSSVTSIDKDRVEELPIPSRNYLTFALLAPQVTASNPALAQQAHTPENSGFSFGGLRPDSNAVYIDGVDDDDEYIGTSRTELSPEAISDFQIVNHGFAAESGGAAGGSIDVQTRAGQNAQHGDAFIFEQNGALDANPPLELLPTKPDVNRFRAGLSTGGTLHRDRTFYYLATEQEYARGEDANDISTTTIAQINQAIHSIGPLSALALQSGFLPTTEQETEFSSRFDQTFTSGESLMLRYALTNNRNVNDAFNTDDLSDRSARGSAFFDDNSLNGTLTSTFATGWLNRLSFEVAQRRAVDRTASTTGPGVLVPGVVQFGTPYAGNDRRFETHFEFDESLLRQYGKHLVQVGASLDHVGLRAENLDGFHGLYVFQNLAALANGTASLYTQSFGNHDTNFVEVRSAAYVQDHWAPFHSLALDYGLRYEDNHLPAPLPQSPINFSSRVGVAYSPTSLWVFRSGFGIFYDRFQLSTINRLLELDGTRASTQVAETSTAANLYQSGAQFSQPIPGIAPSIWQAQPELANPYSEVASLGVECALP